MTILACFLLILIQSANSITFNITNINPNSQNMFSLEGEAYISDDGIQVTPENQLPASNRFTTGRATYIKPLHLWDSTSRELASFSTSFSFVIELDPNNRYHPDNGLTFFLAENSMINGLGPMGLPFNKTSSDITVPFVAVEFDAYCSDWDNAAKCDHVGISINSIASVMHHEWINDVPYGRECQAWIEYDSASRNLSVSFTGFQNNTVVHQDGLVYTVDLRNELPEWVIFGFSAATSEPDEKNNVKSWIFSSSTLQIDESKGLPSNKTGLVVGLIVGPSVLLIVLAIVAWILWRKKKNNENKVEEVRSFGEMNNEIEMGATWPRRFSYLEIAQSTTGFAEKHKLGEGGFGDVYKGYSKDLSKYVAVKRFSKTSKQGIKEYASEVRIISQLRHKNLVQLTGWCHEQGELLLVYEFMENGSLDLHLFKGKSLLTWVTRYKIACGLASALLYLHEEWKQCILHRDIKSSNVMLDSSFNAKLGDFGLAKLVDHEKSSQSTILAGTLGYMAPECAVTGKASKESDVFSFGVVALEIACGRKPIEYNTQEGQIRLPEWVWEHYGTRTLLEVVDPRLGLDFEEEEITRLMIVGLWCVHPDSEFRPSMTQVIQVLNSQASLPKLPSKMPVASYSTPPPSTIVEIQSSTSTQTISSISSYLHGP